MGQIGNHPDKAFQNTISHIPQAVHKALCNPLTNGLLLHRCQLLYLVYIQVNRTVIYLIIHGSELGFHALQLIADAGQPFLDCQDILHAFCLFQQFQSVLLRQKRLFMALQIHIGKRYILHALRTVRHIGEIGNIRQKFLQMHLGNPHRQAGISGTSVTGVSTAIVDFTAFYVAAQLLHSLLKG